MNSFQGIPTLERRNIEYFTIYLTYSVIKKFSALFRLIQSEMIIFIDILKLLKQTISTIWKTLNYGHVKTDTATAWSFNNKGGSLNLWVDLDKFF